ncbi:DUF2851 family protein [Aureispira anguillae]|uniref:DUF2851 family protein n=1 Tax=Aureispira anguillae TaxID=2864201 RepID=A0A915YIL0_9BACT|nr:DUF2851 family protein [Aureispira anguillae]BDS13672.1 DUF2851 family protein [Aureispira anguillae]
MPNLTSFPETFLHYIWKLKLFNFKDLKTSDNKAIRLLNVGVHNHHAGPDFSNARIRIEDTLWAGSVELHKKSSDWLKHGHQHDAAYNNTILHVVYEHDQVIYRSSGEAIPTLELKTRINPQYIRRYWLLLNSKNWIACEAQIVCTSKRMEQLWLNRLVLERLELKTKEIEQDLVLNQNNWEVSFYHFLASSFGVKQNIAPFEALAKSLPLLILSKHKDNLLQLEALLLGQAGFLADLTSIDKEDTYLKMICKEYQFLAHKYQLIPLKASSWKFGRMRPANFPTIRLAQFAVLVHQSRHLFSKILEETNVAKLRKMFAIELKGYWSAHYKLGESSSKRKKSLGSKTVDLILINTVVPFLFLFGEKKGLVQYKERALELLQAIQPEQNSIIANWERLGFVAQSAYETQGLLQLKNNYCEHKRCFSCSIGHKILRVD